MKTSQRALSPFLVDASSGLDEDALTDEAAEAAAGDVYGGFVGREAEEFVQFAGAERLLGVVVEGGQEALVGVGCRGGFWFGFGADDALDDLAGGGQFGEAGFGLSEGYHQVVDLLSQAVGVRGGFVVLGLELLEELGDVHAARSTSSRQVGLGVVRRRSMPAVEAQ